MKAVIVLALFIALAGTPGLPACTYDQFGGAEQELCFTPIAEPGFEYQGQIWTGSIRGYMSRQ